MEKTSRRDIGKPTKEIEEVLTKLLTSYKFTKEQADSLKKVADSYNLDIKKNMQLANLDEFETDDIRATITVAEKTSFNELQAIEILRNELTPEQFASVVKTREYLDDDAFEKLTYNGEVDAALLNPCITQLEPVVTLRLGKPKKKK